MGHVRCVSVCMLYVAICLLVLERFCVVAIRLY